MQNFPEIFMQFVQNPEIEGLSQVFYIFLYDDNIVLIYGFIEFALRSDRLNLGDVFLYRAMMLNQRRLTLDL